MGVPVKWKLPELMERHGLTAAKVEREAIRLGHDLGKNVIYRLLKDDGPWLVDRGSIDAMISAIRNLTGEKYTTDDILEYVPGPPDQKPSKRVAAE